MSGSLVSDIWNLSDRRGGWILWGKIFVGRTRDERLRKSWGQSVDDIVGVL